MFYSSILRYGLKLTPNLPVSISYASLASFTFYLYKNYNQLCIVLSKIVFSQEAHRNENFLATLYELFAIGYHNK